VAAIRPVLFALAAIFLIAAVFAFVNIVNGIQVLYEIWPQRWI
jgi:Flp pilus assembly protein TadG